MSDGIRKARRYVRGGGMLHVLLRAKLNECMGWVAVAMRGEEFLPAKFKKGGLGVGGSYKHKGLYRGACCVFTPTQPC